MSRSIFDQASKTNLADLRDYLRLHNWILIDHKNSRVEVYQKADQPVVLEVVIPRNSDAADFAPRVAETIQTLALLTKQLPEEILRQIEEISEDILRARVLTSELQSSSSIPLEIAVSTINGLKKLLTYSAAGESSSLPFYSRPTKKAVAHTEKCRFGHTFAGSFGFTIESPLPPEIQDALLPNVSAPPFERRVLERIYKGLQLLKQATDRHDLEPLITNYSTGLSANMCDALLEITQSATTGVQDIIFGIEWSPKVPATRELIPEEPGIRVGEESIEYLEAASKRLRQLEDSKPVTIEGRVVMLKSDSQPWEDEPDDPHSVVIAWLDTDGKPIRTRVVLAPADYLTACNAHINGAAVTVSGQLERRGKYTRLIKPQSFGMGRQGTFFT